MNIVSMDNLYICRHGETEWALVGKHTGITDAPLTENGKKQAAMLGLRLQKIPFTKVFSSPLSLAYETGKIGGFEDIIIDPDLQECNYGTYEGLTHREIEQLNPNWNIFLDGTPGGETPEDILLRADRMLFKLKDFTGSVLVFSHGHFSRALAVRWLKLDISVGSCFSLAPASMSILGFEHDLPVINLWNLPPGELLLEHNLAPSGAS